MSLDITDAPVGSTDLNAAAVGVSLGNVATRLPTSSRYWNNRWPGSS